MTTRSSTLISRFSDLTLDEYQVNFRSTITDDDMKIAFFRYLLYEQVQLEPFEFLMKTNRFKYLETEEEKLKLFQLIIKTYFENDSTKKLKISEKRKKEFFSKYGEQLLNKEKWILSEEENIFEDLDASITKELQNGIFPRFIRSAFCEQVFLTNSKNKNIFHDKREFDILTEEEDFEKEIITEDDFDFMNYFCEENYHWSLVHSNIKFNMNTFKLKKNPLSDVNFFQNSKIYKYQSILPFSLEDCIESILSIPCFNEVENNLFFCEEKSFLDSTEMKNKYPRDTKKITRGNAQCLLFWKFPMLTELRRCLSSITSCYDKDGNWIRIIKPLKDNEVNWNEKTKDNIHNKMYESINSPLFIQYKFTKVSEEKTLYTFIYFFDFLGDTFGKSFDSYFALMKSKELRKNLMKNLENLKKNKKKNEDSNDCFIRLNGESSGKKVKKKSSLKSIKLDFLDEDFDNDLLSNTAMSFRFSQTPISMLDNSKKRKSKKKNSLTFEEIPHTLIDNGTVRAHSEPDEYLDGDLGNLISNTAMSFKFSKPLTEIKKVKKKKNSLTFGVDALNYGDIVLSKKVKSEPKLKKEAKEVFNIHKYHIHFKSTIENIEIRNTFFEHLKKEYNTEPLEFLLKVKEFNEITNPNEKLKLFFEIVDDFIVANSPKELNLMGKVKSNFLESIEDQLKIKDIWILKNYQIIFNIIEHPVYNELFMDSFPRFMRTDKFKDVMMKHVNNPEIMELKQIYDYPFTDESFKSNIVTEMDISFIESLMEDNYDWTLIHSNPKYQENVFSRSKSYFPNVSFLKNSLTYKFDCVLPYDFEKCVKSILPLYQIKKLQKLIESYEEVSFKTFRELQEDFPYEVCEPRGNSKIIMDLNIPFTTKPRRTHDCSTLYFDKEGDLYLVVRPYVPDFIQSSADWEKCHKREIIVNGKKKVENFYLMANFVCFKFSKIAESRTKLSRVQMFQPFGAKFASAFSKSIVTKWASSFSKTIHQSILEYDPNLFSKSQDDPHVKLYMECVKHISSTNLVDVSNLE
eukprot:gene8164-12624_t